jgi:hypothetical protein
MPVKARGTIRSSKAYSVFRIIFGIVFLGLGISQYRRGGPFLNTAMVSFFIAVLFIGYGIFALLFRKKIGSSLRLKPSRRRSVWTKLRANASITEAEYEAKRKDILNDL